MYEWNWLGIAGKVYILVAVYLAYLLTPIFMNVAMAWLADFLKQQGVEFAWVVVITFVVGVVAFMIPVVPGAIVYIFGGLPQCNIWG